MNKTKMIVPTAGTHQNNGGAFMRPGLQDSDFPLRILVQSDMVGAIIGRSGSTIKQITHLSKARIDVHREETQDQQEKVITINGNPENCSVACFKIIEVILNERLQLHKTGSNHNLEHTISSPNEPLDLSSSEIQLKILAHNNLIGRLIGRSGNSIKKIMEQTSTKINVSTNSLAGCTNERTITIVGNLEQVRQAQQVISYKLKAAYMADINNTLQAMNQQPYLFNNVPISYMPGPYAQNSILSSLVNSQAGHAAHPNMPSRPLPIGSHQGQLNRPLLYPTPQSYHPLHPNIAVPPAGTGLIGFNSFGGLETEKETVNIYIPNIMVGAIIGKSGLAIKEMISNSGASIRVAAATIQNESDPTKAKEKSATSTPQQNNNPSPDDQTISDETQNNDYTQTATTTPIKQSTTTTATPPVAPNVNSQPASRQSSVDSSGILRKVTVVGTPESQYTAQFLIYRKISSENKKSDISLMVELQVPSYLVGRIIGKGGATVKQIQKQTRTIIRLPDEKPSSFEMENDSYTSIQIIGEFQNSQLAQRNIRTLIKDNPYSSSARPNKSHSKSNNINNNESTEDKSNSQQNFIDNHQSDNGSLLAADVEDDESHKSNEKSHEIC